MVIISAMSAGLFSFSGPHFLIYRVGVIRVDSPVRPLLALQFSDFTEHLETLTLTFGDSFEGSFHEAGSVGCDKEHVP